MGNLTLKNREREKEKSCLEFKNNHYEFLCLPCHLLFS